MTLTLASRGAAFLDEQLILWRERQLERITYLCLDAHYEKVSQDGQVQSAQVFVDMEMNIPEGLTKFSFPNTHRRLIRTTNSLGGG